MRGSRGARVAGVAVLSALALTGTGLTSPSQAEGGERGDPGAQQAESKPLIGSRTKHSSDGVVGAIAPALPSAPRTAPVDVDLGSWPVAPGLTFTQWDRTDARGTVRASLMVADLDTPGLRLDYLGPEAVSDRVPVSRMVTDDAAVAGVNGDFFDITDTGAPLGLGVDRDLGLLHAPRSGWNSTFYVNGNGVPGIGELTLDARVKQPAIDIHNVNSPTVAPDRIGVYTPDWGTTSGSRVVDAARTGVREVVVRGGRVRANRTRLSSGQKIDGLVLIGRGRGAKELAVLKVGRRIKVRAKVSGDPSMAISGNKVLLLNRAAQVVDDREMHPRTAIGIDRDTNSVLFLVIDGRQSFSRGYTMVELARLMAELGAEDALNLDGGGSSAMVGLRADGALGVLNSPSDGGERPVPDGVAIQYTPQG